MYADTITESMQICIDETNRRRSIQEAYNKEHGITPTTIKKAIRDVIRISSTEEAEDDLKDLKEVESMSKAELEKEIAEISKKIKKAAAELDFERCVILRDRMMEMKKELYEMDNK